MTSRADRIRKAVPGLAEEDITSLASLGQAELAVVLKALRQARRDERQHQADRKRQAKTDKRNQPGLADDGFKAEDYLDSLLVKSIVPRAGRNLGHLTRLNQHYDDGPEVMALAVAGARAKGWSDTQIGMALGYDKEFARQEVHRRFGSRIAPAGRRQNSYTGSAGTGELA
jgi:hypothetical protein